MKIAGKTIFKKGFRAYYMLVVSIMLITIAIQTIVQYSLDKQRKTAMVVNLSGRQRMLSQRLLNEVYSCRFHNCDYAELKLTLNRLVQMHTVLQEGSESLGVEPLTTEEIAKNFRRLQPYIIWFTSHLSDLRKIDKVSFTDLRYRTDRFLAIMDQIVFQFQRKSEEDIKAMRVIELELAIFSVLIILFEIFFIVNPIMNRIMAQKKKLEEIAWHQSHAFASHMKNIKDLEYVLHIEKSEARRKEIITFISKELEQLNTVSENMVNSLAKSEHMPLPHHKVLRKVEGLLEKYSKVSSEEITHDDRVHSLK
ncbi:MAG: type IV pili methyl-accepting chemotaxis transducer N-terminal domain-containing protein [Bacteroidota bacterium]